MIEEREERIMVRIAICDDDKNFAGGLETLVMEEAEVMGVQIETEVFFDGKPLLKELERGTRYDLMFLDIEMEHINGIEVARSIRETDKTVLLIYISAYEQYLKELFEVEPFRFLSKPFGMGQFRRYFREAICRIGEENAYYQFSFNKRLRKVAFRDIVYFESRNRVIHIFLNDGSEEQFYGKLNDVEKEIEESRQCFLRIHQSFLVNYSYIKKIDFSNVTLAMSGRKELKLKISEDRQKAVRRSLCRMAGRKAVVE